MVKQKQKKKCQCQDVDFFGHNATCPVPVKIGTNIEIPPPLECRVCGYNHEPDCDSIPSPKEEDKVLEILDKGIKDWEFNKEEWEEQIRLACYLRPDSQMEAQQITDSAIKIIKNLLSKSLLSQRIETANKLKEICNKCRTERGLATAIGNFINQINH